MKRLVASALLLLLNYAGTATAAEPTLEIKSPAFKSDGEIPEQFGCKGANISPPLHVAGVPAGTKWLALSVTDPDAPGGTFTHWLVWNINPKTTTIEEKTVPAGAVQGTNDFGQRGYGGPCPPSGTHRYYFRVFALNADLQLRPGAKASEFEKAIAGHVIARGEVMGRFSH